ncbi:AraC family transcriptional regulator [Pseudomonas sp. SZMC_28357]|uniref:AraC family transcriptional regulator n=1 Tax=Pseudomonas sp. SZMC_28357 TaxID=3074380 RepID=UPI0028715DED|nr:AraC family transcriptional regulator [Pseudomonas sp. SZMC_28357]MDR9753759.1 AraC family transcriptional regulator [Pseudomonas sp. SZMC_28357]
MSDEPQAAIRRLAPLIERQAARYGLYTPIEGLMVSRFFSPSEPIATVQRPVYSVIVQGMKEAMLGDRLIRYRAGESLIAGVDLPVTSRIVEATSQTPYLSVSFELDHATVLELLGEHPTEHSPGQPVVPFEISEFDTRLADPLARLLELLDHPNDIPVLMPLIRREIIWRLLQGPFAPVLRQLAWPDGNVARIARATNWIRDNFAKPLRVAELADFVSMSAPSLHRHFKTITTVSPLQFQKQVRLHMARRRLLASEGIGLVAYDVGYESLSQFNRDYRKLYGLSPSQDVIRVRQDLQAPQPQVAR